MIVLRLLVNLVGFLVPAGLAALACAKLSRGSRDEWQLLAWVPVLPLGLWALYIAWGVTRDPTSHNLWPFELVVWIALSLCLFGLFLLGRHRFGGPRTDWTARRDRDRNI
jgi:hypothetical protein